MSFRRPTAGGTGLGIGALLPVGPRDTARAMSEEKMIARLRQVYEADDFGAELTPELRRQEEDLRARAAKVQ